MNWNKHLKLTPKFYKNGWATFDQVSLDDIDRAIHMGAHLDRYPVDEKDDYIIMRNKNIFKLVIEHGELFVSGKISEDGEILLMGYSGFPMDDKCLKEAQRVSKGADVVALMYSGINVQWNK